MDKKTQIVSWLDELGIPYTLYEHPAVYTMDDLATHNMMEKALIAKNLFLRDNKGTRHFLIVVAGDKRVDLKKFGQQIGARVGFASPERLATYLHVEKGEVTPLGLYYNEGRNVEVFLDKDLAGCSNIGVHPCVNTATVVLDYQGLRQIIDQKAKSCDLIEIS